ncbi:hypothetical protein ACHAO1_004544 [Botrytis cinerea]|uniref:Similar to short-chain dehydrogenase/reductase family protein n=1 Tax=Botryotinia fuckeliana (strain T4) TaxID=999810 RepID=G2XUT2_BOTF4|nr:similar to short-chain dehydrogenase/reductase family protein [Botrytis cinerea T4]
MPSILSIIWNNKFNLPPLPPPNTFLGKSVLITGATSGIGYATAVHFVNLGAKSVIITGRSLTKGELAKARIEDETSTIGKNIVRCMELDMSTFETINEFAGKVTRDIQEIDFVYLNAGAISTKHRLGKEGYESMIEISVLGTSFLALLLLPWMKEVGRGNAHLGIVTKLPGGLHRNIGISDWPKNNVLKYWSTKENWKGGQSNYALTKLLQQYAVNEIAKLALSTDGKPKVIVNSICPGMVKSDLGREYNTGAVIGIMINLWMSLACKTTEGGARTYVLAALTPPSEHGAHYTNYETEENYKNSVGHNIFGDEGQNMQAQVWKEVLKIVDEKYSAAVERANS